MTTVQTLYNNNDDNDDDDKHGTMIVILTVMIMRMVIMITRCVVTFNKIQRQSLGRLSTGVCLGILQIDVQPVINVI